METRSYPRRRREAEEEEEERGLSGNETWVARSWRGAGRREGGRAAVGFEEGLGAAPKGGIRGRGNPDSGGTVWRGLPRPRWRQSGFGRRCGGGGCDAETQTAVAAAKSWGVVVKNVDRTRSMNTMHLGVDREYKQTRKHTSDLVSPKDRP
ncbi:hypothetical protein BHM03_00051574 [Ensete ventricosum]|nr:hypothetical protein BHM03_00051574 [Ensete ventricosum]